MNSVSMLKIVIFQNFNLIHKCQPSQRVTSEEISLHLLFNFCHALDRVMRFDPDTKKASFIPLLGLALMVIAAVAFATT